MGGGGDGKGEKKITEPNGWKEKKIQEGNKERSRTKGHRSNII